jgi:hypothetical protein
MLYHAPFKTPAPASTLGKRDHFIESRRILALFGACGSEEKDMGRAKIWTRNMPALFIGLLLLGTFRRQPKIVSLITPSG